MTLVKLSNVWKNGSSPGCDGLTTSFYRVFWAKIGGLVYASFEKSFEDGQLSLSQRRAIIVLLHKGKNLPRDILGNWRPISLTNTDYKIIAKALACRMQVVIKYIIHDNQVGYIKGRNISTIIRTTDDFLEFIKYNNKTGVIVGLDYSKAFDSINKQFLVKSFEKFGFGPYFIKWVEVLMNDTQSSVQHSGWLSEWFPTECGIRQGCPLFPLSFILAMELLAVRIRQSGLCYGIHLPEAVLKILQYGLKLNYVKGWLLGPGLMDKIQWCPDDDTLKILGEHFSPKVPAGELSVNWEPKIQSMINIIKQWSKQDLTIMGKVLIVKIFLMSNFVYLMQGLTLPTCVLKKIDQIMYKFLWK